MYVFFIHSSVDGCLGCFHILPVINNAAMNTGMYVSFQISGVFFLDMYSGVALLDHMVVLFSALWGSSIPFSMMILSIYTPQSVNSVTQSCPAVWDPMNCSMPGFPVHHQLSELAQTHILPTFLPTVYKGSLFSIPSPVFFTCRCLMIAILTGVRWHLTVLISLIITLLSSF